MLKISYAGCLGFNVFNLSHLCMAGGSPMQTRIITSLASIGQTLIQPIAATSSTSLTIATVTASVSTATTVAVATATPGGDSDAMHLTPHQQTLLARVQSQLKALAANQSRTPEQERFDRLICLLQLAADAGYTPCSKITAPLYT